MVEDSESSQDFRELLREEFLSSEGLKFLGGSALSFIPFEVALVYTAGKEAAFGATGLGLAAGLVALAVAYKDFRETE